MPQDSKDAVAGGFRSARHFDEAERLAEFGSFEWDVREGVLRWSDQLLRIYGFEPGSVTPTIAGFLERIHPDDLPHVSERISKILRGELPGETRFEERIVLPGGDVRLLESALQLIGAEDGAPLRVVGICRDVTALRVAQRERDEAAHRLKQTFDRITDAFVALDTNWHYTFVNEKAAAIFGRRPEDLVGRHIWTEFPEGVGQKFYHAYYEAARTQQPIQMEEHYPPYDRWFENRIYPSPDGLSIYFADVTARKRQERAIREVYERLEKTETFSLVMVTHIALDGSWTKVPPRLCRFLDRSEENLLAGRIEDCLLDLDVAAFRVGIRRIFSGEVRSFDHELRFGCGVDVLWVDANFTAVENERGEVVSFVGYLRDITERKRAEARLEFQALHDPVTGLPNRVLFEDRLSQAIAHAPGLGRPVAVIVIDVAGFRRVNDAFGHAVGDLVLREVSERLRHGIKSTETLARIAGNEFALIAAHVKLEADVMATADRLMVAMQAPFEVSGQQLHLSASAGISVYPADGNDAATLLRHADVAHYRAKEIGGNAVQTFAPSMNERYRVRQMLEEDLRRALEVDEIDCFYQPLYRTSDGSIAGVEALVRWHHPTRGLVLPDEFIPVCEESRLIERVGAVVMGKSTRQVAAWHRRFARPLKLAVNLSVRQFHQHQLLDSLVETLAESAFDPALLELEITESAAMENAEWALAILRSLRERGIRIVIDDFGAGQTSLTYLRQFPISLVKIDKVFVRDLFSDATNRAIVRSVIGLVHDLDLEVAAEGVETRDQARLLEEFGCDLLQGYYFSRPLPAGEMEKLLERSGAVLENEG